jgi:hypothetical protein
MEPKTLGDHQKLLTEVIKKQIVILGPDITLAKARNVQGLVVADDGTVTQMNGDPQALTKELVNQFMELSGLIVQKTMEPLLAISGDGPAASTPPPAPSPTPTTPPVTPATDTPLANTSANMPQSQPKADQPLAENQPLAPSSENMTQSEKQP